MITVVLPQKLEPRAKLSPGGSQHARCHRRHSLTDLLFQVVHVMDRSLIDSVLDVTPQKNSRGVMSGDLAGQAVGPPRPIQASGKVASR